MFLKAHCSRCLERGNSEGKKTSKEAIFQPRDDEALNHVAVIRTAWIGDIF